MARGALRGAASGALSLIVLQGLTGKGSGKVGNLIDAIAGLIARVIDPTVPGIPDHSTATPPGTEIDPIGTGQASADGSSGHQWDAGGTTPTPTPIPATRTRVPVNP